MARATLNDHESRQARAAVKIALHQNRMTQAGASPRQKAEDAQLLNELRANKAAVDLNRALFEYDVAAEEKV